MSAPRSRLESLAPAYDLIVIGGGITGAGILREAVRNGISTLLLERADFASGTSGGSSKLVHGGLRYLQSGQWRLTLESVRERERLMAQAPGLVDEQVFLLPVLRGQRPGRLLLQAGLWVYDRMGGRRRSIWLERSSVLALEPLLEHPDLIGAMQFVDASTDDTRLVQRLIQDSRRAGGTALNYAPVDDLQVSHGRVTGVRVRDAVSGAGRELQAGMVINAAGVWARQFAAATHDAPALRPLRGSHFVFPASRLPITHAISWLHPADRRPVFAYPWAGAVIVGTTDLDQDPRSLDEPRMSADESAYLMQALRQRFAALDLRPEQALSTFSGVRPVVAGGHQRPSAESRESARWSSPGLVSVTGGKLTTFGVTARQVLAQAAGQRPRLRPGPDRGRFDAQPPVPLAQRRLSGRLGADAEVLLASAPDATAAKEGLGQTPYTGAELCFAARHEQVVHLDDLLLRRTRIGLVAPAGGQDLLEQIRSWVQPELGWDDARWAQEQTRYLELWRSRHAP